MRINSFFKKSYFYLCLLLFIYLLLHLPSKWFVDTVYFQGYGKPANINQVIDYEDYNNPENFYLTYVSSLETKTLLDYLLVLLSNNYDKLYIAKDSSRGQMSDKDYTNYMVDLKNKSINNSFYYASTYIGKNIKASQYGILIKAIYNDNLSLKVNDIVLGIDGTVIKTKKDLKIYLKDVTYEKTVQLKIIRNQKIMYIDYTLIPILDGSMGLGITGEDYVDLDVPKELILHDEGLQGPSAGLMFTLYLVDLFEEGDLSKGNKVAGTGTISPYGDVGQIGGIKYKFIGAIKNNVDIFFVPKDIYESDSNEHEVKEMLKKYNTNIKVIPIQNVKEAIDYLHSIK